MPSMVRTGWSWRNMIAYKLFRQKKNGDLTSLFINKTASLPKYKELQAESYETKGYKLRPYWHCMEKPEAPHLTDKGRVWMKVLITDYTPMERPEKQGGTWFLANKMTILEEV